MVNDEQLLAAFRRCRELGAVAQVHAENGDAVADGQQRVFDAGITGPEGHALSRPAELEGEATARAIRLAQFAGSPLYVVHVMSRDAVEEVARARCVGVGAGVPRTWLRMPARLLACLALRRTPSLLAHCLAAVPAHPPAGPPCRAPTAPAGSAGSAWWARRWPPPSPWTRAGCGTPTGTWRRSM